jgi:hypothetical protein
MQSARPNQSQMRGRVSAVVCRVPRETSKAPAQARAIFGNVGARGVPGELPRKQEHERHQQPEKMR